MKNNLCIMLIIMLVVPLFFSVNVFAEKNDNTINLIKGIEFYYNGEYENAIEHLSHYIDSTSSNENLYINALYYQTFSFIENVDVNKAKDNIEILKDLGYEFGMIHWKLGEIYLNKKSIFDSPYYNEARKQLEKASMLGIDSSSFHSDLASAYQGLGLAEKAIKEYELALEKKNDPKNYINLANLYKELNKRDQALKYYTKYLDYNEDSISTYSNIADIYINQNEYNKAIEILEKAININENHFAINFQLARAYFINEEYQIAKKMFEKVIDLNTNNYKSYYYLGRISNLNDDIERAKYYLEQAIKYNPNYADAYIELGDIYLKQGNVYKAMSEYSSAIESNPEYPKAHFHLAKAFIKKDIKEAAISELRETIHLSGNNHPKARKLLNELMEE